MADKLKVAVYWAASCGGCDVAITHIHEKILDMIEVADLVFWPCAMDFKYSDVEAMADGEIDVCLFNGSIRTSDHDHIAKLLRQKSKTMVALTPTPERTLVSLHCNPSHSQVSERWFDSTVRWR